MDKMLHNAFVQSPHTLHFIPEEKKERVCFSKQYGLRNQYLKVALAGGDCILFDAVKQPWQRLDKVRWVQHAETGEFVVIVGGATAFMQSERAQRADMSFVLRTLQDRLSDNNAQRLIKSSNDAHEWHVLPPDFHPPDVMRLADGTSLVGLSASSAPVPIMLAPPITALIATAPLLAAPLPAALTQPVTTPPIAAPIATARQPRGRPPRNTVWDPLKAAWRWVRYNYLLLYGEGSNI